MPDKPNVVVPGNAMVALLFLSLWGTLSSWATATPPGATGPRMATTPVPARFADREVWHEFMARTPLPKKGCFMASFPESQWKETPCTKAPARPYAPAEGPGPATVGSGDDFSAEVTGQITWAVGSFDTTSGLTSETD